MHYCKFADVVLEVFRFQDRYDEGSVVFWWSLWKSAELNFTGIDAGRFLFDRGDL